MKKIILLSVTLFLVFTPLVTNAQGVTYLNYYGTTSITSTFMIADQTDANAYWSTVTVAGSTGQIIWYNYETEIGRTSTPVVDGQAPPNAHGFKLRSVDGGEVYAVNGHNTSSVSPYVEWGQPSNPDNPDNPTVPEGDGCTVCECKQELLDAMAAINNSTTSNGQKLSDILDEVKTSNQIASDSNKVLDDILGEIQTSMTPSLPTMSPPPKLSDNKPPMPETAFKDDTTYFSDKGDTTAQPQPLPTAPEPENWKNEDGSIINPEDEMERDSEQSKDPQMNRDTEMSPDQQMNRDEQMHKDNEMNRDSEMSQTDNFQRDSVFEIDPVQSRDSQMTRTDQYDVDSSFTRDSEYDQTHHYQQAPVDKTLPDWTSN